MKTVNLQCRYPGCTFTTTAPTARGKHESVKHGMSKGLLNGKVATAQGLQPPAPMTPEPPVYIEVPPKDPAVYLQQALDLLNKRESEVIVQIGHLENLHSEARQIARQKAVLTQALGKLSTPQTEFEATAESIQRLERIATAKAPE